jgi:hypothetical protein
MRPLPSFLILGTQRGGTSSLFRYLQGHPELDASIRKETEYFSRRYAEEERWYRAHFRLRRAGRLAFEATPDYLFYPPTPDRVAERLPDARFIVLLRDPVARAVSHYRHMRSLGLEPLSLEAAVRAEEQRIAGDLERLDRDSAFFCRDLLRFSYAERGRYAEQLERWFARFELSRFLVLRSEDLFRDPEATVDRVATFLGVARWRPPSLANASRPSFAGTSAGEITPAALRALRASLSPQVLRLEELLDRPMGWTLAAEP